MARRPAASVEVHGAEAVARQALTGLQQFLVGDLVDLRPALVNGAAGVVVTARGRPITVMGFTVAEGRIVGIDAIADPERVRKVAGTAGADE
ncbi:MAG: hypothetical protein LBJ87_11590 [bacterium]|jgi:RNA polymerase sigma-70 factor (ECF subfamily)|nr:hypothetical protein [bacterium]